MDKAYCASKETLEAATILRHELHAHPELSMHEEWTKQHLMEFLRTHTDLELVDQGRWFYATYREGAEYPNIAFRADMDALPVGEGVTFRPYASLCSGVSHKCGHDGHSAALVAFALELSARRGTLKRNVFLLFQHAEETGQGAKECLGFLEENNISEIYAWHNLPGLAFHTVAAPSGSAQCASMGMILHFQGKKAHASYPETGRTPAFAIAHIISALPELTRLDKYRALVLITVIQINVGERAFGVSAGEGELLLTLRAEIEEELESLRNELEQMACREAKRYGLVCTVSYEDRFPETRNTPYCAEKALRAAKRAGIATKDLVEHFRASEDFGYFTQRVPGAMLYVGDGDWPALHTPEFDFRDELIGDIVAVNLALLDET